MKKTPVAYITVFLFCCLVSEAAVFDSILLNPSRHLKLLTVVNKEWEACVIVPKNNLGTETQDTPTEVVHLIDGKIHAFAVIAKGELSLPHEFDPACHADNIIIGLYPADVTFLQYMASMAQRPLAFCMFSTNEDTVIADKLRCGGSVHELSRAVQTANVTRNRATALATVQTITGAIQLVELALNTIGNLFGIFTGQDEPPPDDTPPRFLSCPHVPKLTIGRGETTVRVNIHRPTYTDDRDEPGNCQLTESPSLNGMHLSAGSYEVTYTVSDSSGNTCDGTCACKVSFEVVGVYCDPITWPSNIARITCTPNVAGPPVWGTSCQYTCLPGYHISGDTTRTCEHAGGSTGWLPTTDIRCEESTCGDILAPQYGTVSCTNGNKYRSVCRLECREGYVPEDPNRIATICQADGWDDQLTRCKDFQPPVFVDCPADIVAFAERSKDTADVTWEEPTAIDKIDNNIEVPVPVHLSEGSPPRSTFAHGQHLIKYTATDAFSNEATCSFSVLVQVITCPPIRYTLKAELSCPNGYVYGSSCSFGCETGYPVVGPTSFSCERNYSNSEPVGYWDWGSSGSQPFCQIVPCPTLRPPDNGALACDGWAYGTFCLIQCNENWDVPLDSPERYVCETLSGTWNPDDDVPDCALPRDPDSMNLPSELYYYSGDCRDPETQVQIQENFIAILNSSDYSDICQLFVECAAENVQVICGNVTTRSGQPSFQLQVTFDLTVKIKAQTNQNPSYIDLEDTLFAMANKIDQRVKGGNFSLDNVTAIDLEVQPDSFATKRWTNLVCEPGFLPNYDTYMCKGCIKGSFLDADKGSCEKCETGQFQDEDGQTTCKPCPPGTWTVKKGSRAIDQCLVKCQPGWYSDTGMEPCAQCEMAHYQPMAGQTSCLRCPIGKITTIVGAKAMNECIGIDWVFNVSSRVQLTLTPQFELQGITFSFWIRPQLNSSDGSIVRLQKESRTLFSVRNPGGLQIAITGLLNSTSEFSGWLRTGVSLEAGNWHNVVVTLNHMVQECKVYVDGAESWSQRMPNDTTTVFPTNTDILLGDVGEGSFAGDISAFSVWNGSLTESAIQQMAQSCSSDDSGAIVTWKDAFTSTVKGIRQRIPSICDDHNECAPNPCGEHAAGCHDLIGSYRCICKMGYTGAQCEVNINDCHEGSCRNGGTCVDGIANYTCVCPDGFKGKLCEKEVVNGGWGEWTDWTPCSATCGNGTHQRWRQCNNPPPKEDGKDCAGPSTESGTCRLQDCPSCLELKPPFGVIMDCYRNDTEDKKYCQIDCSPGLEFSETPLPLYTCGPESQYKWNHQTENNPNATLPSCAHGRIPKTYCLEYEMEYLDLYCTSDEESRHIVESIQNIGSQNVRDVACVLRNTCNTTVQVHHCGGFGKNILPVSLVLVLCGGVSGSFNIEALDVNGNVTTEGHDAIRRLSKTVTSLALAAEEIKNKSSANDFSVVIGGQSFAVDANGSQPRLIADCQPGMIAQRMVCVYCAPGTYYQNKMCVRCPKGSFQELEGQMSCISCPKGFTTVGVGSSNNSDCYVTIVGPVSPTEEASTAMMTNGPFYTSSVTSTSSSLVTDDFGDTEEVKDDSADTITIAIVVVILILIIATGTGIGAFMCKTKRKYSVNAAVDKDDDEQKNPRSQPAKRDQEFQLSLFSEKTLTETRAPNNAHFS